MLENASFVRALARSLLFDQHRVDDVIQEAWVRALERRPGGASLRGWLATLVWRLARHTRRAEMRRAERERVAAVLEELPSAADEASRFDAVRHLLAEVERLEQPYRGVILARFFDDLPPREIARRDRVPLATVKTRLQRALAQLRERMQARHQGDPERWCLALLPIAVPRAESLASLAAPVAAAALAKVLLPLAAAGILGVLAWTWHERSNPRRPSNPVADSAAAGDSRGRGQPDASTVVRTSVASAEPSSSTGDRLLTIEGNIVVTDANGVEHRAESGSLVLQLGSRAPDGVTSIFDVQDVTVAAGKFSARVAADPRSAWVGIGRLVLGGRPAFFAKPEGMQSTGPVEVRAQWAPPTLLHVVDAETAAELRHVSIAFRGISRSSPEDSYDQGSMITLVEDALSPMAVPVPEDEYDHRWYGSFWARADGHAWSHLTLDLHQGGEQTLKLEPSGQIEVTMQNYAPSRYPGEARLSVSRLWDSEVGTVTLGGDLEFLQPAAACCLVPDLPAGLWSVSCEVGDREAKLTLGKAEVSLAAGEKAQISVELSDAPRRVPLQGTLFVHPAWEVTSLSLVVTANGSRVRTIALADMQKVPDRPGLYRWDVQTVLPGLYQLEIDEFAFKQQIEVGPEGRKDVEILIRTPALVDVRVLDADTGTVADYDDELRWSVAGEAHTVAQDAASQHYLFRAPVGFVLLELAGCKYFLVPDESQKNVDWLEWKRAFPVRLGKNEITLPVRRGCGVVLTLEENGAAVPMKSHPMLAPLTPHEHSMGRSEYDGHSCTLTTDIPGPCRITFPAMPGYDPIAPLELDIPPRTFLERVIEVHRSH
jgi:RNA polymerase sigma-70 factor (ECF subfamily)